MRLAGESPPALAGGDQNYINDTRRREESPPERFSLEIHTLSQVVLARLSWKTVLYAPTPGVTLLDKIF